MKTNSFINYLTIGLGGGLGSILRVYIGSIITNVFSYSVFPLSIIIVNILGCCVIGIITEVLGIHIDANYSYRLFLISGFLGGFTTFSAFSLEFALLWQKNLYSLAVLYCLLSVVLSILAFFLGVKIVKLFYV